MFVCLPRGQLHEHAYINLCHRLPLKRHLLVDPLLNIVSATGRACNGGRCSKQHPISYSAKPHPAHVSFSAGALQFHLRTLPAVLLYLVATSMVFVFGASSLFLFALWWATAKRQSKSSKAAAGPLSAELSDESEIDADAESGAQAY